MTPVDPKADTARLLAEAEIAAERLVSVLRMWVAGGLLLFFVVTVGPFSGLSDEVQNRQWIFATATMATYFGVGFVSWRLGKRGLLRRWMIWVTVTLDCVLLLVNIWLSLSNTDLSGQSVFVLPPVWLIPIALAFAMLRVNPVMQIYTAAWVILGLAVFMSQNPVTTADAITGGDFVTFFLAGPPNIMRLVMIALASLVLAIAARRMRELLVRSISETRARANLTRYLPAQIADELAEGELSALRQGRREAMAIMFVDIRGFTGLSKKMSPREVSDFVSEFRRRVMSAAQAHNGMVDKFMGDAAMILFRSDGGSQQKAACAALDAARALQANVGAWDALQTPSQDGPVSIGIGIHWGDVFAGVVGDDTRLEFSVFGDAVNVAARLEAMTKTVGAPIVVSQTLMTQAGGAETGKWRALGQMDIIGRDEGIDVLAPIPSNP